MSLANYFSAECGPNVVTVSRKTRNLDAFIKSQDM